MAAPPGKAKKRNTTAGGRKAAQDLARRVEQHRAKNGNKALPKGLSREITVHNRAARRRGGQNGGYRVTNTSAAK